MTAAQIVDQPPPIGNDRVAIQDRVIEDIEERKRIGIERYGRALQPHNGRDALVDAYQEVLDLAMYVRQEIEERADTRAEGVASERDKIVGFLHHFAGLIGAENEEVAEVVVELAQSIESGSHHDTWPAPPPDSNDDIEANTSTGEP